MKQTIVITVTVFLLFLSGSSSSRPGTHKMFTESYSYPIRKKLDSINLKAAELELLIKKL